MPLPSPTADEKRDDFLSRCMGDPFAAGEFEDQDQRMAVCIRQFEGERQPATNDVDMTAPQSVRNNYKRGLKMHEDGLTGEGIEEGTIRVAKDIAAGEAVTREWVGKANRWWGRNERFLDEPEDSPAYASAMLWGGAAGRDWFASLQKKLEGNRMSDFKSGDQIRVNVRTKVNTEMIRREQRDGRDVIVVKSATMPDDVVMNGILYPAAEIEKGYKTLEGTPAPLGHPTVNDMFVPAKSPLGLNVGYFGAWNANVQRQNGRVMIDKVIDIERANESKMGRRVIAALEQGKPIHTSTGLTLNLRECTNSDLADFEGYDMEFDHDAILLDEDGAATPEQGVGMMVNSKTGDKQIQVVNSDLDERMDEHIDMLGSELLAAIDRKETASRWKQIKAQIFELIGLGSDVETGMPQQRKEAMNMAEDDGMKKMSERMDKLEERMNAMDEYVKNMGDKADKAANAVEAINAEREAAHVALVNKVVEAGHLTEDEAKATPAKALEVMLNASKPKAAPGVNGAFNAYNSDNVADFSPLGAAKKEA